MARFANEVLFTLAGCVLCVRFLKYCQSRYRVFSLTGPPPVQYRKENRPTSQSEAFLDEEFHGTAALVG